MSATIPENMLLSDLLKSTGYDCPASLKDKTFDESTLSNIPSDNTVFNVKCASLSNDYLTVITFPRSNKVTDIAIDGDFSEHYSYNENGYIATELAVEAGTKISVVYDGATYSYTYTGRDYEQHDLVKENS